MWGVNYRLASAVRTSTKKVQSRKGRSEVWFLHHHQQRLNAPPSSILSVSLHSRHSLQGLQLTATAMQFRQQKIRVCVMMERSSCGRVTVDLKTARTTTGMTAFPHILVTGSYGSKVLQDKSIQRSLRGVGLLNGRRPIESLVH